MELNKARTSTFMVMILFAIMAVNTGYASSLYYIYGQPTWDESRNIPFPTIIYKYDDQVGNLVEIWSNRSHNEYTNAILMYEKENTIVVVEGLSFPNKYNVIQMSNPTNFTSFETEKTERSFKRHIYKDNNGNMFIECYSMSDPKKFTINGYNLLTGDKIAIRNADKTLLLSGATTEGTPNSDLVSATINTDGIVTFREDVNLQLPKIPENLLINALNHRWILISNEEDYSALYSITNSFKDTSKTLLIYNKGNNIWNEYNVIGSETSLRIVNDWLVGTIASTNPLTNFETYEGYPPILTGDVILVNPLSGLLQTFYLGDSCEVLYVDGNDIYFRLDNSLYNAKMNGNSLVDKRLLLTDDKIRHMHWAF